MLALTESSEDCACPSTSNAVAAKELERNLPDIGINFEMLLKYLQVLCCDQSKPISKVSEAGFGSSRSNNNVQFVVNIRNVVEWLKKKALDSIIREKFGKESARICKVSELSLYESHWTLCNVLCLVSIRYCWIRSKWNKSNWGR